MPNFNDQSPSQGRGIDRTITASASAQLSDSNAVITANHASVAIVLTIPQDSSVAWAQDASLLAYQAGAAAVSFIAGAGVTLNAGPSVPSAAQYGLLGALRVAANTWVTF